MPFLARDSVELYYEELGSGSPPVVLIHGMCCDARHMNPLAAHFASGHRVIAPDLRGHGRSAAPVGDYTIEGFAVDIAWLCGELGLVSPVVIGHSMGGAIALEVTARHPDLVGAIVLLDSAVLPAPDAWARARPVLEALGTDEADRVFRDFLDRSFFRPDDRSSLKDSVIADMLAAPAHVRDSVFANVTCWDSDAAAGGCQVPVLYIGATRPRANVPRFRELAPQLVFAQVVCSGHFVQLEVPEQVNAMVERFLTVSAVPDGATLSDQPSSRSSGTGNGSRSAA
jgi:pimeloyl-ACP methyl ester carboxylesterase